MSIEQRNNFSNRSSRLTSMASFGSVANRYSTSGNYSSNKASFVQSTNQNRLFTDTIHETVSKNTNTRLTSPLSYQSAPNAVNTGNKLQTRRMIGYSSQAQQTQTVNNNDNNEEDDDDNNNNDDIPIVTRHRSNGLYRLQAPMRMLFLLLYVCVNLVLAVLYKYCIFV